MLAGSSGSFRSSGYVNTMLAWNLATLHALAGFKTGPCYMGVGNPVDQLEIGSAGFEVGAGLQSGHNRYTCTCTWWKFQGALYACNASVEAESSFVETSGQHFHGRSKWLMGKRVRDQTWFLLRKALLLKTPPLPCTGVRIDNILKIVSPWDSHLWFTQLVIPYYLNIV